MSDEKRMDTALLAENDENTAAEENALVIELDKPFTFEGQTSTYARWTCPAWRTPRRQTCRPWAVS